MNSPPELDSPSPSTPSSGSPPPDEDAQMQLLGPNLTNIATHLSDLTAAFSGGSSPSKRRLPGSSFGAVSSSRDPKTRRREESRRGGGSTYWESKEGGSGRKEKDDLIDVTVMEDLRRGELDIRISMSSMLKYTTEIGDPFQEESLKSSA